MYFLDRDPVEIADDNRKPAEIVDSVTAILLEATSVALVVMFLLTVS